MTLYLNAANTHTHTHTHTHNIQNNLNRSALIGFSFALSSTSFLPFGEMHVGRHDLI